MRRADVDERGLVRDVAFFEFFQEARIRFLMDLHTRGQHWSQHVVARTDIDYLAPVHHRREPYAVHSWIGHVGTPVVHDPVRGARRRPGARASAAVVMVTFDMETQRTTEMADSQRARLLQELR